MHDSFYFSTPETARIFLKLLSEEVFKTYPTPSLVADYHLQQSLKQEDHGKLRSRLQQAEWSLGRSFPFPPRPLSYFGFTTEQGVRVDYGSWPELDPLSPLQMHLKACEKALDAAKMDDHKRLESFIFWALFLSEKYDLAVAEALWEGGQAWRRAKKPLHWLTKGARRKGPKRETHNLLLNEPAARVRKGSKALCPSCGRGEILIDQAQICPDCGVGLPKMWVPPRMIFEPWCYDKLPAPEELEPEKTLEHKEEREDISSKMKAKLKPKYHEIPELYLAGYSPDETAHILKVHRATVFRQIEKFLTP